MQYTKAKLIGYTTPVLDIGVKLGDVKELIAYCARVSNPSNQNNTATTDKLLNYLIKHKHWSPFEMASATVEIETTRDIARQLLRHRSFSFQEYSQRYADPTKDLTFVLREARLQDQTNRQNSIKLDTNSEDEDVQFLIYEWNRRQQEVIDLVRENYSWAVNAGIAKEQARSILPEGNTMSKLYVQGTLRSFIHYIEVRTEEGTQLEHQELAFAVAKAIAGVFNLKG
jgi:thymidylate synthase (FAD)